MRWDHEVARPEGGGCLGHPRIQVVLLRWVWCLLIDPHPNGGSMSLFGVPIVLFALPLVKELGVSSYIAIRGISSL